MSALAAIPASAQAASWLPHSLIFPPGISTENLLGISCATTTSCLAVGQDGNGVGGAHAEIGVGSGWTPQSGVVRNPGPKNGAFLGASCPTASTCVAAGQYGTSSGGQNAMAQEPASPTWSLQSPSASGKNRFNAISCTTAAWCMAVGFQNNISATLAMTASGPSYTTWSNASAPAGTALNGVSCLEKTGGGHWCMAVGWSGTQPLAEVYDAGTWTTLPAPAFATGSYIVYGVSCRSTTWCAITGDLVGSGVHNAITQIWNGASWSSGTLPTKPPGTTQSVGYGISCVSTTECYAVGEGNSPGTLPWAAKWDGTTWTTQTTPLAPGAGGATLRGVSCPATNRCEAAGWSLFGGTPTGLIESYN